MRLLIMIGLISICSTLRASDDPKPLTPKERYEALLNDYETEYAAWQKANPNVAYDDPRWIARYESLPTHALGPRLLRFAEANLGDPIAVDALLKIIAINPSVRQKGVYPDYLKARDILIRDYLLDPRVIKALLARPTPIALGMEPYYRGLMAQSTDHEVQGRARMSLVRALESRSQIAALPFFEMPEERPERQVATAYLNSRLDPEYVRYIKETDQVAIADEIETVLETVARDFGDVPLLSAEVQAKKQDKRSLADYAREKLNAIRTLNVGQVAPEIEGKGIDGQPLKLSDFRGKVVMLVFWGTWCGPCMRMVEHEKAMIEHFKGKPFALVGVNAEIDAAKSKPIIQEKGITWPSFVDGDPSRGPIARRWTVRGWPTIYILDEKGVIRFKNLPHHIPRLLDEKVDELLKEMGR